MRRSSWEEKMNTSNHTNIPDTFYLNKLAELAREACEKKGILSEKQKLTIDDIKDVVGLFGGTIEEKSSESKDDEVSEKNINDFQMIKDSEDTFKILYCSFDIIEILHEFAHVFIDFKEMSVNDKRYCNGRGMSDISAYIFARAFLMPKKLFESTVIKNTSDGICNIDEVAKTFGVSSNQVVARGKELNLWS